MKTSILIFTSFITFTITGFNQPKENKSISKIVENKQLFIGKSLKHLLNEIEYHPTIAYGHPGINGSKKGGRIVFYFDDRRIIDSLRKKQINPLTLTVFTKEFFEMDNSERLKEKTSGWKKSDEKKYGMLTVEDFFVSGGSK